ncbi:hypothetical protein KFL_011320020 [Klebsormidium nitens]|uniref:Vacuolar protein 8 n=1 Tax=Klebsormidium nitens TaxID=105231 RepID=A0A1Y1IPF9_KLENI|nr:hypothetical protein KFL_011320020 [Klebsormidium nitens]|eukprot:GAQ92775.1 hypothetical protein KFL_011320020 [Klebsormidium nitens]
MLVLGLASLHKEALAGVPDLLEGLVAVLDGATSGEVVATKAAEKAAETLNILLRDNKETCKALRKIGGSMRILVGLLGSNSQQLQLVLLRTLGFVVSHVEGMGEELAGLPGCVANLVKLLECPADAVKGNAAGLLTHFATEIKSPSALAAAQTTIAKEPTLLPKLAFDLSVVEENEAGRELRYYRRRLGELLRSLCRNMDNKQLVAGMPGCLEGILGLLERSPYLQEVGATALSDLVTDVQAQQALAKVPGVVPKLIKGLDGSERIGERLTEGEGAGVREVELALRCLLNSPEAWRLFLDGRQLAIKVVGLLEARLLSIQLFAADILNRMAATPAGAESVAGLPGCLEKLVAWFEKTARCSEAGGQAGGEVLVRLTACAKVRRLVARVPGVLEVLVGALNGESEPTRGAAGATLCNLALDAESRAAIVRLPGCLKGLFPVMLEIEHPVAPLVAVSALDRWAKDSRVDKAIVRTAAEIPGAIERLVARLSGNSPAALRAQAGDVLAAVATEAASAKAMVSLPGCLAGVVRLAKEGNGSGASVAVSLLLNLAAHPDVRTVLRGDPDVRAALVANLNGGAMGMVWRGAAEALEALDSVGGAEGGPGEADRTVGGAEVLGGVECVPTLEAGPSGVNSEERETEGGGMGGNKTGRDQRHKHGDNQYKSSDVARREVLRSGHVAARATMSNLAQARCRSARNDRDLPCHSGRKGALGEVKATTGAAGSGYKSPRVGSAPDG